MIESTVVSPSIKVNRFFIIVLWLLFGFSLCLAPWHSTWLLALCCGSAAALLPTLAVLRSPESLWSKMLVGAALMVFAGLNIHQSDGMLELHFGIFVLLALLLCYEDWRVIVGSAVVIAVHHLGFTFLQMHGYSTMCMAKPQMSIVFVHAAYVVVESAALCYLAVVLNRKTRETLAGKTALQEQLNAVTTAVTEARSSMEVIARASSSLAVSSEAMASSTQEQAASLEETAASMVQIAATVRQNAENADTANEFTGTTAVCAEQGAKIVSEAICAMSDIEAASGNISAIVSTISEIAFQINLLAVNASIEAARAGEHGRGFAVVASEVRSLAQKTSTASSEIGDLIRNSISKVHAGTSLVSRSGTGLQSIVQSIRQVERVMSDIASASHEQTTGVEQVNIALSQMDGVTQANSTQASEVSCSIHSLAEESQRLMKVLVGLEQRSRPVFA